MKQLMTRWILGGLGLLTVGVGTAAQAQTSPQLAQLNSAWASIAKEDRAELVLLPALAQMDAPPAGVDTIAAAALLTPDDSNWAQAASWAAGEHQSAALEALTKISERRSRYVFAQPYGRGASADAINAGLFVDLGDPPMIAGAKFGYFDALDKLGRLVQIEATRLGSDGDGAGALDLVTRWIRFARSFADRDYFVEKKKAFGWMRFGLERLRDLAYLFPDSIDDVEMKGAIRSLADRELNLDRIRLPHADRLAADELLASTFVERGGPNPNTFSATMSEMKAGDRPLLQFAQAARWQRIAQNHADYFDTRDKIAGIFNDWSLRWDVGPHDILLEQPADYDSLDKGRFALIEAVVPDLGELFIGRQMLHTELEGTRLSLAVVGYKTLFGDWPNPVFAVRPRFIREIPIDPWDASESEPLQFFVPVRDQPKSERSAPKPHVMEIVGDVSEDSEAAAPTALNADDIYNWIKRSAHVTPAGSEVSPQLMGQLAKMMPTNMPDSRREQMRSQMLQQMPAPTADLPQWMYALAQVDPSSGVDPKEVDVDAVLRIMLSPEYRKGLTELSQRPTLTMKDLRRMMADVAMEILGGASSGLVKEVASAPGSSDRLYAVPSFPVTLDQSSFVLYSIGPDGKPGRAAKVGPGGDDLLLWPPLFSLVRDHLHGR